MFYSTAQRAITLDWNKQHTHKLPSQSHCAHVLQIFIWRPDEMSVLWFKFCVFYVWSEGVIWDPTSSATGDTVRSDAASGAGVSLLFFVLQEVGWLVSLHPPPIHHLQGRVPTGVVHTAQWSVPAGGQRGFRPRFLHFSCDVVSTGTSGGYRMRKRLHVSLPFIIEDTVGHI